MDAPVAHALSAPMPLNVFQRLVLQWERIHPYNAAQVLRLSGRADAAALTGAWQETLNALSLGRVQRRGTRFAHEAINGELERYPVQILPAGTSLCQFLSGELNRAFDDAGEPPFRPFVLEGDGHHFVGIVYHHWVADSVSIRILLREWFFRIYCPERARTTPLRQPEGGYWSLFGPGPTGWGVGEGFLSSVRWSSRNRRVARVEHPGFKDFNVRFSLHEVGGGLIGPLIAYARRNDATLNDVFLAVVADVCHRYVPLRRTPRRTDLALGTIVDLRPYARRDLSDTFGLFLGFTSTICRPGDLGDFSKLLRTVSSQSKLHKRTGVPLSSPVRMFAGLAVGKMLSQEKVVEFYRKRVPLAGGISNVNLNRTWAAEFHPSPLEDYVRVSPTGPMMPLVFTPTTLGQHLHVGLTFRPSVIEPGQACRMAGHFVERLRVLAGAS
jgi:hypothetical protein